MRRQLYTPGASNDGLGSGGTPAGSEDSDGHRQNEGAKPSRTGAEARLVHRLLTLFAVPTEEHKQQNEPVEADDAEARCHDTASGPGGMWLCAHALRHAGYRLCESCARYA